MLRLFGWRGLLKVTEWKCVPEKEKSERRDKRGVMQLWKINSRVSVSGNGVMTSTQAQTDTHEKKKKNHQCLRANIEVFH